jgi:ectoine hydroxylase-related dioxygenase (phytanoyl-CoA dioxygenase family)
MSYATKGIASMSDQRYYPPAKHPLRRQFLDDGAVCLKGALNAREIKLAEDVFNYRLENRTRQAVFYYKDLGVTFFGDTTNIQSWASPPFQKLLFETRVGELAAGFLSTDDVWFYYESIIWKEGPVAAPRGQWHQDLTYIPAAGPDFIRFWISLDPVPKENSLEFIKGSNHGPLYVDTQPDASEGSLVEAMKNVKRSSLPPTPDIEADRSKWEILSWAVEPGDVVAFHPGTLHGGAGTYAGDRRRTLALVFYGKDIRFTPRAAVGVPVGELDADKLSDGRPNPFRDLRAGDPFRVPHAIRLRSSSGHAAAS